MRTRLRLFQIGLVIVPLVVIVLVLKVALPWLAGKDLQDILGDDYHLVETKDFEVWTTLPEERVTPIVGTIEDFRAALYASEYGEMFGLTSFDGPVKLVICESREDYLTYMEEEFEQDFTHSAAIYSAARKQIAIVHGDSSAETLRTILHETVHMIFDLGVSRARQGWSLWFAEGIASYFEGSSPREGGTFKFGGITGTLVKEAKGATLTGNWVPLGQLVEFGPDKFYAGRALTHYAQSAFLIYYLMQAEGGALRGKLAAFFEMEKGNRPPGAGGLELAVGMPLEELDQKLRDYVIAFED